MMNNLTQDLNRCLKALYLSSVQACYGEQAEQARSIPTKQRLERRTIPRAGVALHQVFVGRLGHRAPSGSDGWDTTRRVRRGRPV